MENIDKAKLYKARNQGYYISEHISIHVPTVGEVIDYGEEKFFSDAYSIVLEPVDLKWQLWDIGIDWTKTDAFELFCTSIAKGLTQDKTSIFFGDILDFSQMKIEYIDGTDEYRLVQNIFDVKEIPNQSISKGNIFRKKESSIEEKIEEYQIIVDRYSYKLICDVIRDICNIARKKDKPKNEITKIAQIEDAKDDYFMHKNDPYPGTLFNLISSMVNSQGFKRNDVTVMDMNLYAFMDSVKRIQKIQNVHLLLQSGYSGFGVDLKKINKKELDWLGDIS